MPYADATLPNWARAHGKPLFAGLIKQSPGDFNVAETLGYSPSGDGEHDYLLIEKTAANTAWVAGKLARHASVSPRDVGYAGLKDRHAVTTQWFSVRRPSGAGTDWNAFDLPGVNVLEQTRHGRKLKRGAHDGNRFRIVIRSAGVDEVMLTERCGTICASGVPNYFGSQRFGRGGNNLALAKAIFAGKRVKREQRSIAISAARSFIFNEVLTSRVSAGTWNEIQVGEPLNLDGSNSYFVPDDVDDQLRTRLTSFDVHPTGPLFGTGNSGCKGAVAVLENSVADANPDFVAGLESVGARTDRRALRLPVHDFRWQFADEILEVEFRLSKGSYATTVLRELMAAIDE